MHLYWLLSCSGTPRLVLNYIDNEKSLYTITIVIFTNYLSPLWQYLQNVGYLYNQNMLMCLMEIIADREKFELVLLKTIILIWRVDITTASRVYHTILLQKIFQVKAKKTRNISMRQ